jgi:hypothetical protein
MPVVSIPASLRGLTRGVQRVEVQASGVRQLISRLDEQFPGISRRLTDGDRLRPGIAVAIDSRISDLGLLQPLQPESEVHFVMTAGGG